MLLHTEEFNFSSFEQDRKTEDKVGLSGKLLLAENGKDKYIVKYTDPFDASFELMAASLAQKLRIKTPDTYLFSPTDEMPHAVGIRYLTGLKKPSIREGMIKSVILNYLVCNGDKAEYAESEGVVYTLDFGECFCFDYRLRTAHFFDLCKKAAFDEKARDQVDRQMEDCFNRYMHNLGYANTNNYLATVNILATVRGLQCFTKQEVESEWIHVWRRLRCLPQDAFIPMRRDLAKVYGDYFAFACWKFIEGLKQYYID